MSNVITVLLILLAIPVFLVIGFIGYGLLHVLGFVAATVMVIGAIYVALSGG